MLRLLLLGFFFIVLLVFLIMKMLLLTEILAMVYSVDSTKTNALFISKHPGLGIAWEWPPHET